jgi:hypothetical protein
MSGMETEALSDCSRRKAQSSPVRAGVGPERTGPRVRKRARQAPRRTQAPLGNRLRSSPGNIEHRKRTGGSRKKADHAFRDDAEGLATRAAGLQQGAQFADLRDGAGLDARLLKQAADRLVGDREVSCAALRWTISCCWAYWVNASRRVKASSNRRPPRP